MYNVNSLLVNFFPLATYCGAPPRIADGYVSGATGVTFDRTANYTCVNGYDLIGGYSKKCLASAQWETPPNCVGELYMLMILLMIRYVNPNLTL